jgi:hypothetical protein
VAKRCDKDRVVDEMYRERVLRCRVSDTTTRAAAGRVVMKARRRGWRADMGESVRV